MTWRRVSMIVLAAGAAALQGCATPVRPAALRPVEGFPTDGQGGTAAAVFGTPALAEARAEADPRTLPGFDRRDAMLSLRESDGLRPIGTPPPQIPSIDRRRRTTLPSSPGVILFFEPGRRR